MSSALAGRFLTPDHLESPHPCLSAPADYPSMHCSLQATQVTAGHIPQLFPPPSWMVCFSQTSVVSQTSVHLRVSLCVSQLVSFPCFPLLVHEEAAACWVDKAEQRLSGKLGLGCEQQIAFVLSLFALAKESASWGREGGPLHSASHGCAINHLLERWTSRRFFVLANLPYLEGVFPLLLSVFAAFSLNGSSSSSWLWAGEGGVETEVGWPFCPGFAPALL